MRAKQQHVAGCRVSMRSKRSSLCTPVHGLVWWAVSRQRLRPGPRHYTPQPLCGMPPCHAVTSPMCFVSQEAIGDMLSRQWNVTSGAGAVFRSGADQRMNGTMVDMLLLGMANETGAHRLRRRKDADEQRDAKLHTAHVVPVGPCGLQTSSLGKCAQHPLS